MHFQEWCFSFVERYFCSSDYESLFYSHIKQTILLSHTVRRYTISYIQMSESCLEMYLLVSDMDGNISMGGGLICFDISTLVLLKS